MQAGLSLFGLPFTRALHAAHWGVFRAGWREGRLVVQPHPGDPASASAIAILASPSKKAGSAASLRYAMGSATRRNPPPNCRLSCRSELSPR
jgi:hypothetical protein